jgi:hypothetical protein
MAWAVVGLGLAGSAAVAAVWFGTTNQAAALAAFVAGLAATGAQTLAHLWMAGVPKDAPVSAMWRRHLHGTALRVGAAGLMVVLVLKDREMFPPLATVLSFAGVLLGLMTLEIRNRA